MKYFEIKAHGLSDKRGKGVALRCPYCGFHLGRYPATDFPQELTCEICRTKSKWEIEKENE